MKVIAQRGGHDYLLVKTRTVEGEEWGRVFNVPRREMGREMLVAAIAKFGYWENYVGSQDVLSDLTDVLMIGGNDAGEEGGRA